MAVAIQFRDFLLTFSREDLGSPLGRMRPIFRPQPKTLDCYDFARHRTRLCQAMPRGRREVRPEDYAEPMLRELGLIYEERKGHFSFRRGPKPTLHDGRVRRCID